MIHAIGFALLCTAWLMPGHYFPWRSFQQEMLAASGMGLVALSAVVSRTPWVRSPPLIAIAVIMLATVPLLQWGGGLLSYRQDAVVASAYLLGLALMIIAGSQLAQGGSERVVGPMFVAIGIGAVVSTGLGLAQWFQLGPFGFLETLRPTGRIGANFHQPNQLATLLALGIAATWWAFERERIGSTVASLVMALLGFGMAMTQSRTVWLFIVIFVFMWHACRRKMRLRTSLGFLMVFVTALLLMALAWPGLSSWAGMQGGARSLGEAMQPGSRWTIWQTLWDALLRSPWSGYGWLQVSEAQQAATLDHAPAFSHFTSAHNLPLDLLLWNGIPLGLVSITLIAWWIWTRFRSCYTFEAWAMMLSLALLAAHSMVELPLHYAYYLLPAGMMVGVIEAQRPADELPAASASRRRTFCVTGLALGAFLWIVGNEYAQVEEAVQRARMRDAAGHVRRGAEPFVPQVWLLDGFQAYVKMWLTSPGVSMPATDLAGLQAASDRYPTPRALMTLAMANALNGRAAESQRALHLLCHLSQPAQCARSRDRWAMFVEQHPFVGGHHFPSVNGTEVGLDLPGSDLQ